MHALPANIRLQQALQKSSTDRVEKRSEDGHATRSKCLSATYNDATINADATAAGEEPD
jgi:hypothetical protein